MISIIAVGRVEIASTGRSTDSYEIDVLSNRDWCPPPVSRRSLDVSEPIPSVFTVLPRLPAARSSGREENQNAGNFMHHRFIDLDRRAARGGPQLLSRFPHVAFAHQRVPVAQRRAARVGSRTLYTSIEGRTIRIIRLSSGSSFFKIAP